MYQVRSWGTDKIFLQTHNLAAAKRECRRMGHDGTHNGRYFAPVAYVSNLNGECVYNPVFRRKE